MLNSNGIVDARTGTARSRSWTAVVAVVGTVMALGTSCLPPDCEALERQVLEVERPSERVALQERYERECGDADDERRRPPSRMSIYRF